MAIVVRVQPEAFDVGVELAALHRDKPRVGAIASFIGTVRDRDFNANDGDGVATLTLEHYPGMTERAIREIVDEAAGRWSLYDVTVIHRVGTLAPTDAIVLVATSAAHRGEALDACAFVIDFLKTRAPFWKKEVTPDGEGWVEARASDDAALQRWAAIDKADEADPPGRRAA